MRQVIVANTELIDPIAVFDAGIGSYSAVRTLRDRFPQQDILYFADRAHFPYGEKSVEQLKGIIGRTLQYLADRGAAGIVVASNVPSVTVLDQLKGCVPVPVVGVVPPLRKAVAEANGGHVAILGARSMIESAELRQFIHAHAGERKEQVSSHNASSLIELVETGRFLTDPAGTAGSVQEFMRRIIALHPDLRAVTLSSTHLPWLLPFLKDAEPRLNFLDPIEQILDEISPAISIGSGRTAGLVSGNPSYPAADFPPMLRRLGIDIPLELMDD